MQKNTSKQPTKTFHLENSILIRFVLILFVIAPFLLSPFLNTTPSPHPLQVRTRAAIKVMVLSLPPFLPHLHGYVGPPSLPSSLSPSPKRTTHTHTHMPTHMHTNTHTHTNQTAQTIALNMFEHVWARANVHVAILWRAEERHDKVTPRRWLNSYTDHLCQVTYTNGHFM